MSLSLGPFITCFVGIVLLTIYFNIILYYCNDVFSFNLGTKIIFGGILLIFVRMSVPINFPFTYTFLSSRVLPATTDFLYQKVGNSNLMLAQILFIIWIIIAVCLLCRLLCQKIRLNRFLRSFEITDNPQNSKLFHTIQKYCSKPIKVTIFPYNISPAITGILKPTLILPDVSAFSDTELEYVIGHEIGHFNKYDLWMILLADIVCCIHWWNPFVYIMKRKYTLALELSNDTRLIKSVPDFNPICYADLVLKIAKSMQNSASPIPSSIMSFVSKYPSTLRIRIQFILDQKKKKNMNCFLPFLHIFIICLITVFSLFIVAEATSPIPEDQIDGSVEITAQNAYFVEKENGFDLYVDKKYFCFIDHIPDVLETIPIYEKEESANETKTVN